MSTTFNVYCDESCHLLNDHQTVMVLGAVWCPAEKARQIAVRLREIKARHGLKPGVEVKWTKVSPSKRQFYVELVDYFLDDDDLHFRALIVPDKGALDHAAFGQTHDDWYYKMYFALLKGIIDPSARFRIYLDIKDTRGAAKVAKLHDVLANAHYDFAREIVERIQTVRSHEVELLQLADLLIGAVSYANRGLAGNAGKEAVVARLRKRSGKTLTVSTFPRESKVNIFRWTPRSPESE
jgi:hypothetical protein